MVRYLHVFCWLIILASADSQPPPMAANVALPPLFSVPVVLFAIDQQFDDLEILQSSISLLCENNKQVVLLSNVKQRIPTGDSASCLQVVDVRDGFKTSISSFSEMQWPVASDRKLFQRWFVLKNWMHETSTPLAFIMDNNAIMTLNITDFVHHNWLTIQKHEIWLSWEPPKANLQFALVTNTGMNDITAVWAQIFMLNVSELFDGTSQADAKAMALYSQLSRGAHPHPCLRNGGSCETISQQLRQQNIRAAFMPGTLGLNADGHITFLVGVVDKSFQQDSMQWYEMKNGQKMLRFWKGIPQLQLRANKHWVSLWGYVLEQNSVDCAKAHINHVTRKRTCTCADSCCKTCVEMPDSPPLTVWSMWRNNFETLLLAHARFYLSVWRVERLFLNMAYDNLAEIAYADEVLNSLCGPVTKTDSTTSAQVLAGSHVTYRTCSSGQEILSLIYPAAPPGGNQVVLMSNRKEDIRNFYHGSIFDTTVKKLYIDHDEFHLPAHGDVATLRDLQDFTYHIVDMKPVLGSRDWTHQPLDWVDQPYYYRFRAGHEHFAPYPNYWYDGQIFLTSLKHNKHFGPYPEHDQLRQASGQEKGVAYQHLIRNHNICFHMAAPSEDYYMFKKHYDQTSGDGNWNSEVKKNVDVQRQAFRKYFLDPERDYVVFLDEILRPLIA